MPRRTSLILLVLSGLVACSPTSPGERLQGEIVRLQSRLVAPCCWTQTLDNHESPLARSLRDEITLRLGRGEDPATIEADLIARHGPRIRAAGDDVDLDLVPWVGAGAALVALLVGTLLGLRWVRRGRALGPSGAAAAAPTPAAADDRLEQQLDDELDRMD
jgi:cytochrome c-type biogenesis protein CcmH